MEVSITIETFDKKSLRCIDRRERKKAVLSVQRRNGGVQLVSKAAASNDLWITRGGRVFDAVGTDGKLSVHLPEYQQVLLISAATVEQLSVLAVQIRGALASASPPKPQPLAMQKQSPLKPARTTSKSVCSPEKYEFWSPDLPNAKKKRQGQTPTKDENTAPTYHHQHHKASPPPKASRSPTAVKRLQASELTELQKQVIAASATNKNLFITGGAGTGKSALLEMVAEKMRQQHGSDHVFVCATTGLAACAIGGTTIHQFAGLQGQFNDGNDKNKFVQEVLARPNAVKRWQKCKGLIVDEISMLSSGALELIDLVGQRARGCKACFGGVQVILVGDFFQLPPVTRSSAAAGSSSTQSQQQLQQRAFCFNSPVWQRLGLQSFSLDRVFRQVDTHFISLLAAVRWGRLDTEGLRALNGCVGRRIANAYGILPTQLFTHKSDVDALNSRELDALDPTGEARIFAAVDSGEASFISFLDKFCPAKALLKLKEGAQVILLKTIDAAAGLANGTRGIVVRFQGKRACVRFADGQERVMNNEVFTVQMGGRVVAQRSQIPLDLSWGISVHKSQGQSLDCAVLHLRNVFEFGQAYVALSRVRTAEGLSLSSPLEARHIKAHPEVVAFYTQLLEKGQLGKT